MIAHADINGLLDKCTCGAYAGLEDGKDGIRARCTECCETGPLAETVGEASVKWNAMIREKKG